MWSLKSLLYRMMIPLRYYEVYVHEKKQQLSRRFCDVDKWFIQQEWWTIWQYFFFSTEGNRAPYNNSAVIKQFLGQWDFLIKPLTESWIVSLTPPHLSLKWQIFFFWMIRSRMIFYLFISPQITLCLAHFAIYYTSCIARDSAVPTAAVQSRIKMASIHI